MLTTEDARALITTSLDDADLAAVIEREQSWLARRIGALTGERVETFIAPDGDEVLLLTRPTTIVVVEDTAGWVDDVALRGWSDIVRTAGSWSGDVLVTYEPSDEDEVRRALITLVRLTVNETAYSSESAGGYMSSVSFADQRMQRFTAWRSLLRPRRPVSMRIQSAIPRGGRTGSAVGVEPTAS